MTDTRLKNCPFCGGTEGNGWQLAETAPDDTEVFAWSPKYGGIYLAIKQAGEWWVPDLHPSNWEPIDAPTHWMPLPAAPTEARDE